METATTVLGFLTELPPGLIYLVLGLGAALENVVPPIPADTFVLLGGILAGRGGADPWLALLATWGCNVAAALAVYGAGLRYGRGFFERGPGRRLLDPGQLEKMGEFYARWGPAAIFFTRFLPGFRAVVPVFAGVSRQPFLPVALPLAAASLLWYGALVWIGAVAGRNLEVVVGWLEGANRVLLAVALVLVLLVAWWWWRTRGGGEGEAS